MANYFVGIDVSKSTLDIAVVKDGILVHETKIANQVKSVCSLITELQETGFCLRKLLCAWNTREFTMQFPWRSFLGKGLKSA